MSSNIIINSSNYVKGSGNRFEYTLPNKPNLTGFSVSLIEATMYNSTFNITSKFGNNQFYLSFPSKITGGTMYATNSGIPSSSETAITIQDGFYSVNDLTSYIENICVLNNIYCVSNLSSTTNVYFISLVENPTQYAVSINLFQLNENSNYSLSAGSPLALNGGYLSITFLNGLGSVVGFPDSVAISNTCSIHSQVITSPHIGITFVSPNCPNVNVIDSYLMCLNLVNNKLNVMNQLFYSIALTTGIGGLLSVTPKNDISQKVNSQAYDRVILTFYDQNLNPLTLNDSQVNIILSLIEPKAQ